MTETKKYKILMVDDDKFLLNMYETKFKNSGHEITSITSSEEALRKLREGLNPDVVVLDVVIPSPDGLETLSIIRKEKLASQAAIIMLTNQGESTEIERAQKLGMDGYIVKAALIPSEVVSEVIRIAEEHKSR